MCSLMWQVWWPGGCPYAVGREGGSVPGTCLSPAPLGLQQDEDVALVLAMGRAGVQSWLSRAHSLCSVGVWKDSVSRGAVTAFGGAKVPL